MKFIELFTKNGVPFRRIEEFKNWSTLRNCIIIETDDNEKISFSGYWVAVMDYEIDEQLKNYKFEIEILEIARKYTACEFVMMRDNVNLMTICVDDGCLRITTNMTAYATEKLSS